MAYELSSSFKICQALTEVLRNPKLSTYNTKRSLSPRTTFSFFLEIFFSRTVPCDDNQVELWLSNASSVSKTTVWSLEECGKTCSLSETCGHLCGEPSEPSGSWTSDWVTFNTENIDTQFNSVKTRNCTGLAGCVVGLCRRPLRLAKLLQETF